MRPLRLPLLIALILAAGSAALAQPLYRWVDEKGEVHYTDQLPPEHADKSRVRFSEQGIAIEVKPPTPTKEEQERAKEEERRRAEEERLKAERLAEDRRLLQSYRTVEELELARNGQIAIIEAVIQSKRDQVRPLSRDLFKLDRERQALQSANKPPPEELNRQIESSLARLRAIYGEILDEEQRKLRLWDEFDRRLARYLELKRLPPPAAHESPADALPMLSCQTATQCHAYWKRALIYMRAPLAGGELEEFAAPGLNILLHRTKEEERLMHLVWIQRSPEQAVWIYLDLQCRNRQTGGTNCLDPQIAGLREGFQAAVKGFQ